VAALVIDLSGVNFLGKVGLRILVSTNESLDDAANFALVADGPATSRPIQLTNLDKVFALYPTVDAAWRVSDPLRIGQIELLAPPAGDHSKNT
jgi:anti-sigma B factor antagonist